MQIITSFYTFNPYINSAFFLDNTSKSSRSFFPFLHNIQNITLPFCLDGLALNFCKDIRKFSYLKYHLLPLINYCDLLLQSKLLLALRISASTDGLNVNPFQSYTHLHLKWSTLIALAVAERFIYAVALSNPLFSQLSFFYYLGHHGSPQHLL